jgi:D-glycero-alpha-D-manno-heptose-7-phosphate kinase
MYAAARRAGALGGKLLGAGGGGFMVIFAKPEDHRRIRASLPGCLNVPFRFDYQGSQIIVYQPDELPLAEDPFPPATDDDDLASYAAALSQAGR